MKLSINNKVQRWVKQFLPFYLFTLLPLTVSAQGIPYLRNYPATEYKGHNMNFDVIAANDGTLYAANFEGLLYYDNSEWRIIHTPGISRITAVFQDSKGRMWTGGYNYFGYLKVDEHGNLQMQPCTAKHTFQGEVQWIFEQEGTIYFLASDKEVYAVRNDSYVWAAGKTSPSSQRKEYFINGDVDITQVEELEGGLEALSTNGNGVIFVDSKGHELFRVTEQNGLCSNNVSHMDYNHHGLLWGATDNGLFCIAFPSIYTHFTSYEGLHGEVLAIEKLNGHIYAGTQSGLFRLDGKTFVPIANMVHACWQLVKQNNALLAATSSGVFRISATNAVSQLTKGNTLSILADEANSFYTGETDGVFYYQNGSQKKVSDIEKVVKILRDKSGSIWLQNLYGKIWKNNSKNIFEPYSKDDKDEISTLVEFANMLMPVEANSTRPVSYPLFSYLDTEGVTWLTNNKGKQLYAYKDGAKEPSLSASVYPLMDYSVRAMLRDDKLLWVGGDKGVNIIDREHDEPSKLIKPRLLLRSILLHGDSIIWGGYGKQPTKLPDLPSNEHHIVFNYSIDFPNMLLKTQYRTRINGGKWSAWETATTEEYSNLTYGKFLFEVQARDAFGQLSDIVSIRFSIVSPFYMRWYMNILYLVIAGLLVYAILQWRLRRLEKDKHRLERIVQERTTEVVRLEKMATVGKLTQGLIDRILNPLNYINNFAKLSEGLVKDVKANVEDEQEHMDPENYEDTMDVLDMLKGNLEKVGEHGVNTTRTLKAMEEMLKDRSGGIVPMDLTPILHQDEEMLRTYFKTEITQYSIDITFNIPTGDIRLNGNGDQLSKAFTNLLGNAVYAVIKKAKKEQGQYTPHIGLDVNVEGDQAVLKFTDNGIGIEQTIIDKIFDPFFTTKTTGEAAGVGLYLCHEIVQNHRGTITVQSEKDNFTEFTITLPTL
jgi:signal transduction histidine kinase